MMKTFRKVALLFLVFGETCLGEDALPKSDEDLAAHWEWVRPEEGSYSFKDGSFLLKSSPGNIWGKGKANHILTRSLEEENVCITTTVTVNPEVHGEQAGLMLYWDDDHYCKVVKEWFGSFKTETIVTARESEGKGKGLKFLRFVDEVAHLRIVKIRKQVICFVRGEKEETFTLLSRTEVPVGSEEPLKLALYSSGAKKGADHWATFHSLEVEAIAADVDVLNFLEP